MRYDAVTRRGMSGGPVFDVSGRVVGVHGRGDRDAVVANEVGSPGATTEIKTGFNAAVPVNYFLDLAEQTGINLSKVKVDEEEVDDEDAVDPSDDEVRSWEESFGAEVGMIILHQLINIPFRLF